MLSYCKNNATITLEGFLTVSSFVLHIAQKGFFFASIEQKTCVASSEPLLYQSIIQEYESILHIHTPLFITELKKLKSNMVYIHKEHR
jgi:hypothetical protein